VDGAQTIYFVLNVVFQMAPFLKVVSYSVEGGQ